MGPVFYLLIMFFKRWQFSKNGLTLFLILRKYCINNKHLDQYLKIIRHSILIIRKLSSLFILLASKRVAKFTQNHQKMYKNTKLKRYLYTTHKYNISK
jgi:hypothetical protein